MIFKTLYGRSNVAVKEYKGPDEKFLEACKRADIKPTMRQRKKWLKRIGSAWANKETEDAGRQQA